MRPILLLTFVVALGEAIHLHSAAQERLPYLCLALALLAVAAAAFAPLRAGADLPGALPLLALAALVLQAWQLITAPPQWALRDGARVFQVLTLGVVGCAVVTAAAISRGGRSLRAAAVLVPSAALALGIYVIYKTPNPWIDVHMLHVESFKDLLAGRDPYGQWRPNIYHAYPNLRFYSPENLSADGSLVKIGFPYTPLQLLLALPGHLLAGDYRYMNALALPASAALMTRIRPGPAALAAAALFLLTPAIFYVIEGSWTEPMVVLMFSLTLWCAARAPRFLWLALGGLLSIKQYTAGLVVLAPLLLPPERRNLRGVLRLVLPALALTAAIDLPFFLWNPAGFFHDLVTFQGREPIRFDSLSWFVLARMKGLALQRWTPFAVFAVLLVAGLFRAERSPRGFAAATALAWCAFFAFAWQAFANYYLFPLGAGAWALALGEEPAATTAQSAQTVNQGA